MAAHYVPLQGNKPKQRAEAANFEAFHLANPRFCGDVIARSEWGADPPDVLCFDAVGRRIGVELTEWLNEEQIAQSINANRREDSYTRVIRSQDEAPPDNFGFVLIETREVRLAPARAVPFRDELYRYLRHLDCSWEQNPEWNNLFEDFTGYPCLIEHLVSLVVYERRFSRGIEWIMFRPHGGAYRPEWMRDSLLENIRNKCEKYQRPEARRRLLGQRLDELVLLAYYDQAILHNSPYDAPGFGFADIVVAANDMLNQVEHPFHRVFLFSPMENDPCVQVWPRV